MKTIICDISLFSMDQPVYEIEDDGQMTLKFQTHLDELGPAIADYCKQNNIELLKIVDKAGYADRVLVPAIKDYAFHNYSDFNTKIEVKTR